MKRICMVTSGILPVPAIKGGAVEQLVTMLCENNEWDPHYEITVLTHISKQQTSVFRGYEHTTFVNIPTAGQFIYRILWKVRGMMRRFTGRSFPQIHFYERGVIHYLVKNHNNFDLIINEACDLETFYYVAKRIGNSKICLHLHGPVKGNECLDKSFSSLISVSEFIKYNYISTSKLDPCCAFVAFNGINSDNFQKVVDKNERDNIRQKLGFESEDFVVLFCGRIIPEKGVLELMQSILDILDSHVKLLIIGTDKFGLGNSGHYAQQVEKLSIQHFDRIKYTGFINNNEVYKYYKIADIGVVPSMWNDPCPLVLIEMIVVALPTIATRMGGIVEIGTDETTLFIDNNEHIVENLKESIATLYNNKQMCMQMSIAARERSIMFTRERYFKNMHKCIDNILDKD